MKNLCTALSAAFPEIEGASKDKNNPHFKSKYADLGAVVDAIKPALVKHGLFFAQLNHEVAGGVCVETIVCHSSGEQMSFGKLFVPASKNDAQGYGSALTYARRYSLMTAFGVAPEDDDGNAAARTAPPPAARSADAAIDPAQYATLTALIRSSGADTKKFLQRYNIRSVDELPAKLYKDASDALTEYAKAKAARAAQPKADPVPNPQRSEELADEIPY